MLSVFYNEEKILFTYPDVILQNGDIVYKGDNQYIVTAKSFHVETGTYMYILQLKED